MKLKTLKTISIHLGLFIVTVMTTIIAGYAWIKGFTGMIEFSDLSLGVPYAFALLLILGTHEFGHYFASLFHKVKVTLPYFIPLPPIDLMLNFGTLGAVIRSKSQIKNTRALFDIGIWGPLSGVVVALIFLTIGFTHLPGKEFILSIHPDYFTPGAEGKGIELFFGDSLLFAFLRNLLTNPQTQFVPPMSEIYHYPFLCAGWFGLLVTAMNLIPVGQLDGGHIVYAMFGEKVHSVVSHISLLLLFAFGVIGLIDTLYSLGWGIGWSGWLFWAFMLYFLIKPQHPKIENQVELGLGRKILGALAILLFFISFIPLPFSIV